MEKTQKEEILSFMYKRIRTIFAMQDSEYRASLAKLRRGVGHAPGDFPELMGYLLLSMPDKMVENDKTFNACYEALTLFALHQQGHSSIEPMHTEGRRLGGAIASLVTKDKNIGQKEYENRLQRVRSRFNILATSSDEEELVHHLRGMIQMLSAQSIAFDYGDLAVSLYYYQIYDYRAKVRLKWGKEFYTTINKMEESKDE